MAIKKENERMIFVVDKDLATKIREKAREEGRSISNLIRYLIMDSPKLAEITESSRRK